MPFPNTGILDNFNRANGDLGASWTADILGASWPTPDIASNQCKADAGNSWSAGYYNVATYGPDCEVYATIPVIPAGGSVRLMARITSPGSGGTVDGYEIETYGADSYLTVCVNGVRTTISVLSSGFSAGDGLGLECIGSTITGYRKPAAGSWGSIGTVADFAVSSAGYVGILFVNEATARLDDFGGGTVGGPSGGGGGHANRILTGVG